VVTFLQLLFPFSICSLHAKSPSTHLTCTWTLSRTKKDRHVSPVPSHHTLHINIPTRGVKSSLPVEQVAVYRVHSQLTLGHKAHMHPGTCHNSCRQDAQHAGHRKKTGAPALEITTNMDSAGRKRHGPCEQNWVQSTLRHRQLGHEITSQAVPHPPPHHIPLREKATCCMLAAPA